MFSKYITKIQLKLANVLKQWAESIFIKLENRKNEGTETHNNELFLQSDEFHDAVERHEQAVTELVIPIHPEQNLTNESGQQTESHSSFSFNRETVSSDLNSKRKTELTETRYSASSSEHTVINKIIDDNGYTILSSTGATTKQREQTKEKPKNNDATDVVNSSTISSQEMLLVNKELKDSSINVSNHVSDTFVPQASKSFVTSFSADNQFHEGSNELVKSSKKKKSMTAFSMNEKYQPAAEATKTNGQHGERSKDSSINRLQSSIRITEDSPSAHHARQAPVNTTSHWPSLHGQTNNKSDSQIELAIPCWPELPIETTATELSLLSAETIQASIDIVREMDRIRNLENEQKGMLWNA